MTKTLTQGQYRNYRGGEDGNNNEVEIVGVDDDHCPTQGEGENNSPTEEAYGPPENTQGNTKITGVTEDYTQQHPYENELQSHKQEYDNEINIADDNVSIKEKSPDETYVTINDINIVREMNTAQMNIDPETGEERDNEAVLNNHKSHNNHQYNLQP